jgi:hypothetical protein
VYFTDAVALTQLSTLTFGRNDGVTGDVDRPRIRAGLLTSGRGWSVHSSATYYSSCYSCHKCISRYQLSYRFEKLPRNAGSLTLTSSLTPYASSRSAEYREVETAVETFCARLNQPQSPAQSPHVSRRRGQRAGRLVRRTQLYELQLPIFKMHGSWQTRWQRPSREPASSGGLQLTSRAALRKEHKPFCLGTRSSCCSCCCGSCCGRPVSRLVCMSILQTDRIEH